MRVFHGFDDVKKAQKCPIFTFKAIKNPLKLCWRQFCAPDIIYLYENLLFLFYAYSQILLTKLHDGQNPPWYKIGRLTVHC